MTEERWTDYSKQPATATSSEEGQRRMEALRAQDEKEQAIIAEIKTESVDKAGSDNK